MEAGSHRIMVAAVASALPRECAMRAGKTANRRTKYGHVTAAIVALLLLGARASGSEGYISLYYNVEGVGESSYTLSHSDGASEGLDEQDMVWYFIACVTCKTDTRAVSSADGEDLKMDVRPLNSESGASVYCGVVSKTGDSIVTDNAAQWVDIYIYGFEGYDVTVNGEDARTTSRIDLGSVTGAFSSGETLESLDISFTRRSGDVPPDPPTPPGTDPGQDEEPGVAGEPVRDALFITNSIEGWPQSQTGVWRLLHAPNALEAIDANDIPRTKPAGANANSLIVSTVSDPATGAQYLLAVDARPTDSPHDIDLGLGVESASGEPIRFAKPAANKLIFAFPAGAKDCFTGKPITFQQYNPVNPAISYPVWDVRKIIAKNQGVLPLADLLEYRSSGVPYLRARVSTSRRPGDVLRDGRIDANDYNLVAAEQGLAGPADTDIASPKGLGLPDGAVDAWDLHYVYELLDATEKNKVTPPALPVLFEGFESGTLDALNWYSMQWPQWFVTSEDRHSGTCSARAGKIADGAITSLSLTVACTAGRISFWRKVSCEYNWDNYRFYIDNRLQEELSGEVPWSEVSFPIEAGPHTFRWEYEKDGALSSGKDTVYLDDVRVPAAP